MPPEFTIREAAPADAETLIAYMLRLLGEPGVHLISQPDEFTVTVEAERRLIAELAAADNSVMLLAIADGQVAGIITCRGDARRAKRHSATIGISVAAGRRDQGIGSALMSAAIAWARSGGVVTRLELLVFAENQRAVYVYQKLGFEIEGCLRRAIFKDGRYHDEYVMGMLLDPD